MKDKEKDDLKLKQEIRALVLLKALYPNIYTEIIKDERPDLKDFSNNVGIEVTCATYDIKDALINNFKNEKYNKNTYLINKIKKDKEPCGVSVNSEKTIAVTYWNNISCFIERLKDKLKKLIEYKKINTFELYDLYINSESFSLDAEDCNYLLKEFIKTQEDWKDRYRFIYIQISPLLYKFDLVNNLFDYKNIYNEISFNLEEVIKEKADKQLKELTKK